MKMNVWKDKNMIPAFDNILERFVGEDSRWLDIISKGVNIPAINVVEDPEKYILEVAAPGLKKDDFIISVDKGILSIKSEKEDTKEEQTKTYMRKEYSFNSFYRSFILPENVDADKILAKYETGILKVLVPKIEVSEIKKKTIEVH